jgi:hypothetical protein
MRATVRLLVLATFASLVGPGAIRMACRLPCEAEQCVHCGATLRVAGGRRAVVCRECGREQPDAEASMGHGRH